MEQQQNQGKGKAIRASNRQEAIPVLVDRCVQVDHLCEKIKGLFDTYTQAIEQSFVAQDGDAFTEALQGIRQLFGKFEELAIAAGANHFALSATIGPGPEGEMPAPAYYGLLRAGEREWKEKVRAGRAEQDKKSGKPGDHGGDVG